MLREEIIKELKEKIREINKEKNLDKRLSLMITTIDEVRSNINDELDDIFSAVNLKKNKLNLEEE